MKLYDKVGMTLLRLLHEDKYFDGGKIVVFLTVLLFYILSSFGKIEKCLKGDSYIKTSISVPNKYVIGDLMYP